MDFAEECAFSYFNSTSENGTFLCDENYLHVSQGVKWTVRIWGILIFALQIAANFVVIWVLLHMKSLSKANLFILSLAFSDLLSGVTSAVGGYREDPGRTDFGLSKGIAYFYITLEFLTTMTTWMNISLFAMLRYLCICLDKDFKQATVIAMISSTWTVPIIILSATLYGVINPQELSTTDHRYRAPFANLENILGESSCSKNYMLKALIIPFGIIYVISFSMLIFATANLVYYIMKYRSRLQSLGNTADTRVLTRRRSAVIQLLIIIGGFIFGATPWTIQDIAWGRFVGWRGNRMTDDQGFEEEELDDLCQKYRILHFTHIAAYSALRLSEAMNPFLYILGSRQLKNEVFNFFGIKTGPKMVRSHENPALSLQEITRTTSADTQAQCFH